jgi:hypothetical protein
MLGPLESSYFTSHHTKPFGCCNRHSAFIAKFHIHRQKLLLRRQKQETSSAQEVNSFECIHRKKELLKVVSGMNADNQMSSLFGGREFAPHMFSNIYVFRHVGLFIRLNPRGRKMLPLRRPDRQFQSHVPVITHDHARC